MLTSSLKNKITKRMLGVIALAAFCGGCATGGQTSVAETEKMVLNRAQTRWDLLLARKLDKAYDYLSPASKETTTMVDYIAKTSRVQGFKSVKVDAVKCEEERCKVDFVAMGSLRNITDIERQFSEYWIKIDGNWWNVYNGRQP
jgi:hypothetical protein